MRSVLSCLLLVTAAAACGEVEVHVDAAPGVDAPGSPDAPVVDAAIDAPVPDAAPPDAAPPDAPTTVTVTVTRTGPMTGSITSTPAGIDCGSTCTASFPAGTQITLAAAPLGTIFSGWGGPCSGTGPCTFTATADTTVTAAYRGVAVAIAVGPTSCLRTAGNSADLLRQRLIARGHTAAFADAAALDTANELNAFDVVVFGGPGDPCAQIDAATYDGLIDTYVRTTGRGIVASGWFLYNNLSVPSAYANLPTIQSSGYFSGVHTVTPSANHPISAGVAAFSTGQWLPYGGGTKPGATAILTGNGAEVGAAWGSGNGRAVFLGPMFLENHGAYDNENLLDGTQAAPIELILRAVEWAAKAR